MQALKLVAFDAACVLDHARDSERIMAGELREQPLPGCQKLPRAMQIAQISHRLAGEHRIVGEPALLRAFDLGVPVSALDQPHHHPPAQRLRLSGEPVDHRSGPLLIGLHRQTEAFPTP